MTVTTASLADGLGEEVKLVEEGATSEPERIPGIAVATPVGSAAVELVEELPRGDVVGDVGPVGDVGVVHANRNFSNITN